MDLLDILHLFPIYGRKVITKGIANKFFQPSFSCAVSFPRKRCFLSHAGAYYIIPIYVCKLKKSRTMTNSRWSEELTCKFVQKYKEQNCLWDPKNINYTSKVARNSALTELVQHMDINGFGIEEARAKIRSVRSTYLSEKSKINKSLETATEDCEVYKSNLKWFHPFKLIMGRSSKRKNKDQASNLLT